MEQHTPKGLPIRSEGDVLNGRATAAELREKEAAAPPDPRTETYRDVGDYDPVLRFHCRL